MSTTENKIKNIFIYLTPSIISSVLPLLALPIITRFLTPLDFGVAALAISTTALIVSFLSCGVDAAAQRYYFEYRNNPDDLRALISTTIFFLIFIFVLIVSPIYWLSGFIAKTVLGSEQYRFAIFVSYINGCCTVMVNFYLLLYRNMEKAKYFSAFTITHNSANTVLTLILVVWFGYGYMGIIYGSFLSSVLIFAVLFVMFYKAYPFHFKKHILIDNLKYGIPLIPNVFTSVVYQFFDKYMLSSMASLASVGVLSIAQNLSGKLFVFMTALQSTFDPLFMKDMFDRGEEGAASVGRNFTIFTYLSIMTVLVAILFGEEIMRIMAPPSYYEAIDVMLILLCGISIQTFGKIVGSQLAYIKKAYLSFPITVVGLLVNVGINLALIPRWQAVGAAMATLMTIMMMNGLYVLIAQRGYKIVYEHHILVPIYVLVFISTFILIYLRSVEASYFIQYSFKVFALIAYGVLGVKAEILTREKMNALFQIITFRNMDGKWRGA